MHPGIKLRHVRTFLAIAAEGNLSAVARAQRLTQPALSRTLAELETLLGKPMFHRQGRRLKLTEAGIAFRRPAAEAVQLLETAAAAVHPSAAPTSLRLGVLPTAARRLFPDLAFRFREARPETVLVMMTGAHEYLLRLLREGRIDLMIGRMPAAADIAGLSFTHLYDEEVVIALRAGHSMVEGEPAQLLTRLPVILPPEGAIIRRAVDDWIALQGLGKLRPAFETVSPEIGRSLVLSSDAAWLISGGVIRPEVVRGEMIAKPLGTGFMSGPVGITRREDDAGGAAEALILRLARAVL